jgi:hypothetical protein
MAAFLLRIFFESSSNCVSETSLSTQQEGAFARKERGSHKMAGADFSFPESLLPFTKRVDRVAPAL